MAEPISIQQLKDASLDVKSLEEVVNGDENVVVTTRLGETYPSVKSSLKKLFESGGLPAAPFATKTLMVASALVDGDYAYVTDDTTNNGLYVKTAGLWVKSDYDPLNNAKAYTDVKTSELATTVNSTANLISKSVNSDGVLDAYVDPLDEVYRYTDASGGVHVPLLPYIGSLQDNLTILDSKKADLPTTDKSEKLVLFHDSLDDVYAWFEENADLVTAGGLVSKGGNLTLGNTTVGEDFLNQSSGANNKPNNNHMMILDKQLAAQTPVKTLFPIALVGDNTITKRMPSAIKTSYGIMGFHHQKTDPQYNGDGQGSSFWKFIVDIDDNLVPTLRSRELWLEPATPSSIVKHPTLGRLANNDILMIFEQRLSDGGNYIRFRTQSSDEGLTWTPHVEMTFSNPQPSAQAALGTTCVITRTSKNRLIVPMYLGDGRVYSIYSDDEGVTWTNGALSDDALGFEPSIIEDMNNSYLIMDLRPLGGQRDRKRAVSYDWGETWIPAPDGLFEVLKSPENQGTLFKDEFNGVVIQTHNNTDSPSRIDYCLSVSLDGGYNFPFHYYPFQKGYYAGYSHVLKYAEGVYIAILEYNEMYFAGVNTYENTGIIILNTKELLNNASFN